MNDHIKNLAEQAGLGQERWNNTDQFNAFLDKFAKSIVKDCAKQLIKEATENCDEDTETYYALIREAKWMKKTFGVEE